MTACGDLMYRIQFQCDSAARTALNDFSCASVFHCEHKMKFPGMESISLSMLGKLVLGSFRIVRTSGRALWFLIPVGWMVIMLPPVQWSILSSYWSVSDAAKSGSSVLRNRRKV